MVLISSLLRGMDKMEEVARWTDGLADPRVGVELIAFTHDGAYWDRLTALLKTLTCPVSFHGPYIGTEGTSRPGTPEHAHLVDSYRRVFALAGEYGVRHVVYHTTQRGADPALLEQTRRVADENACYLAELGQAQGVELLVENLPYPRGEGQVPLYSNEAYTAFFDRYPQMQSIVDIGHAHMNGMDVEGFLSRHGVRVRAYHFHNNNGTLDQHKDIRDGTFSFDGFAPVYRRDTPDAPIVLEYEPHVTLSWGEVAERVDYLKRQFGA